MALFLSWVVFPLVMAAMGWGWGTLVERAAGMRLNDALVIPAGLAAALVVAGTITTFPAIAPATVTVVGVGAVAGLALALVSRRAISRWPLLVAVGVLLAYGAPTFLSGQATFTGVVKLDDTATWLNVIDNVVSHGRSVASLPWSTYRLNFEQANPAYPLGSFVLAGVSRGLTGIDMAWVFEPYLAACAAAMAMSLFALMEQFIASPGVRAFLAFIAAQAALLYAYAQWSGIKELTAGFLLVLGIALTAQTLRRPPERARQMLPLALAAGGLIQVLSIGAGAWMAPALVLLLVAWSLTGALRSHLRRAAIAIGALVAMTIASIVPVLAVLGSFLGKDSALFSEGQSVHTKLGNLLGPLKAAQLAGIWPVGDFRTTAPLVPTAILIGVEALAVLVALWLTSRRRQFALALYLAVALLGCAIFYLGGATPWVVAKSLAISSPAFLTVALVGAGMLWSPRAAPPPIAGAATDELVPAAERRPPERADGAGRRGRPQLIARVAGVLAVAAIAGGVLWSNVLTYGQVTLASRPRMAELQHIGSLVAGKGPTFINEYEVYADRHFLREGAPTEPAEYRIATLPLRNGKILTKAAWADLNQFPLQTLRPFRSIVTRRSPDESRPPSIWKLVWQGRYYQLWQRPEPAPTSILEQVPYGESNVRPYCGVASNGPIEPLCSVDPVAIPSCPQVRSLAHRAALEHAHIVAYVRPRPTVAYGDEVRWPASWYHNVASHSLLPLAPGTAVGHIAIPTSQRYEMFIAGGFSRGLQITVDGRRVGTVKNELGGVDAYTPVASLYLSAGVHTVEYTYPESGLAPGSAEDDYTELAAVSFEPLQFPVSQVLSLPPQQATQLCGQYVNWIEIVAGSSAGS